MNNAHSLIVDVQNEILLENKNNTLDIIKEKCDALNKTISRATCLPWYKQSIQNLKMCNLK